MSFWRRLRKSALFTGLALLMGSGVHGACRREIRPSPRPVWMDVDPAVMRGGHEPDDGLALLQAFHSPELEVRGVSAVFGNAPLQKTYPIARDIVTRYGPAGVPVHAGAAGADDLGRETDASRALSQALGREKLTILALGPVTNVATVLQNQPQLAGQIEEIVAVAGRRPGQRFVLGDGEGTPLMDLNFELDPDGFQVLLSSNVRLVLAPFEISSKVPLTEEDVARMENGTEASRFFVEPIRDYFAWYQERFGIRAIFPYDTLAVAYLTSPQWIEREELPVEIRILTDDIRGDREKPYLIVSGDARSHRRVLYCYRAHEPFKEDLLRRLLRR